MHAAFGFRQGAPDLHTLRFGQVAGLQSGDFGVDGPVDNLPTSAGFNLSPWGDAKRTPRARRPPSAWLTP